MAFCTIDTLNLDDRIIYQYPGFSKFTSSGERFQDAVFFLNEPEKLGKANLIYGLFRTSALQACIDEVWGDAYSEGGYAGDVVFNFSFVCRYPIVAHDAYHLHKRQPTHARHRYFWRHPRSYRATKQRYFESYLKRCQKVAPTKEMAEAAESILRRRQSLRQRSWYSIPLLPRFLG